MGDEREGGPPQTPKRRPRGVCGKGTWSLGIDIDEIRIGPWGVPEIKRHCNPLELGHPPHVITHWWGGGGLGGGPKIKGQSE